MVFNKSVLCSMALVLTLGACSSSDDFGLGSNPPDDSGDDPTGPVLALGTGSGGSFSSGSMTFGGTSPLDFGGSATISVNLVDTNNGNALFETPTTISFSSGCADEGLATIDASAITSSGAASVSYSATSCQGSDTVTATIDGSEASVTFSIGSLSLGTGSGGTFVEGAMSTTLGVGEELSFGGDTAVSVNIVNSTDNSIFDDSPVTVSFTSNCVQSGLSSIDGAVIATNGTATASYSAQTCQGTDTITATLQDGTSATTNVTVANQIFGSLQFVSASPSTIALQGSGSSANPEVSEITFLLRDNTGEPIQGETVSYELSTTVGGITLSSDSSVTANDGTTSVSLNAGGVNISVSVTATVTDNTTVPPTTIVTTSSPIAIVGGIPDQNSFSISVSLLNPRGI